MQAYIAERIAVRKVLPTLRASDELLALLVSMLDPSSGVYFSDISYITLRLLEFGDAAELDYDTSDKWKDVKRRCTLEPWGDFLDATWMDYAFFGFMDYGKKHPVTILTAEPHSDVGARLWLLKGLFHMALKSARSADEFHSIFCMGTVEIFDSTTGEFVESIELQELPIWSQERELSDWAKRSKSILRTLQLWARDHDEIKAVAVYGQRLEAHPPEQAPLKLRVYRFERFEIVPNEVYLSELNKLFGDLEFKLEVHTYEDLSTDILKSSERIIYERVRG